jgi:carbon storage regulator CsrA
MLVLTRKPHEKITLPTVGATIEVVQIKGGVVRLGIDAPPEVPVLRAELAARAANVRPLSPPGEGAGERQFRGQVAERLKAVAMGLVMNDNCISRPCCLIRECYRAGRPGLSHARGDELSARANHQSSAGRVGLAENGAAATTPAA